MEIWKVSGSYKSVNAIAEEQKEMHSQNIDKLYERTLFEKLVATWDPLGRDVWWAAANSVIGLVSYNDLLNKWTFVVDRVERVGSCGAPVERVDTSPDD